MSSVLYSDADLLVVDKPCGVLSVRGRGDDPCLSDLLRGRHGLPRDEPFHSVHRLDRDAGGVIVFARTREAERALTRQFEAREVEKVYLALVRGQVAADGEVDLPISADRDRSIAGIDRRDGKPSVTRYRVIERLGEHSLLECHPLTGRLHQIRVHLAAIDHPLSVDPQYGGSSALYLSRLKSGYRPSPRHDERPLIARLTLHAARITLTHPSTNERITFEAPIPKDLRATINQLRRLRVP
jgi:RluA family pseudouridine synthase